MFFCKHRIILHGIHHLSVCTCKSRRYISFKSWGKCQSLRDKKKELRQTKKKASIRPPENKLFITAQLSNLTNVSWPSVHTPLSSLQNLFYEIENDGETHSGLLVQHNKFTTNRLIVGTKLKRLQKM